MKRSTTWRLSLALLMTIATTGASAAGDAAKGEIKARGCTGCHGVPGYFNVYPTYHVPKVGGQNAGYIVNALKAYKSGERAHPTMRAQAASLTEQEMQDIAAYFSSFRKK